MFKPAMLCCYTRSILHKVALRSCAGFQIVLIACGRYNVRVVFMWGMISMNAIGLPTCVASDRRRPVGRL